MYFRVINISQLPLAEKNDIKNLGLETTGLVISQSSASRIQT